MPGYVRASLAELLQLLCKTRTLELDGRLDDGDEVVMGHLIRSKAYDLEVGGEETSSFLQVCQPCYLRLRVGDVALRGQRVLDTNWNISTSHQRHQRS